MTSKVTSTISRNYFFESAHFLPLVPDGHKCKRLHGHTYQMEVTVHGEAGDNGFIIDFWDLDAVVAPLVTIVDHRCLNDIAGLENPTAENIAKWFLERTLDVGVRKVSIWETRDCYATAIIDAGSAEA